ncbi:MAG: NlpC/P60 family protein [Syntrophomonadaceae bacterium]|nr:NlpC/P60 family protein [Syntrophomonadaceae bacterium]
MRKKAWTCILALYLSMFAGIGAVMASPATYIVKSGDCLWTISNSTGVSVDTIKQLNGLTSDFLQVGQVLALNNATTASTAQAVAPSVPATQSTSVYVICPGDNLWTIAQKFGTTVDNLKALNGLTNDALYAGNTLIVSGTAPAVSPVQVSRSGSSVTGSSIVAKAAQYLGTPYRYGGASPGGFDCSGFTTYIYSQFGISLNRTAAGQYSNGFSVSKAGLAPGDLVFFRCYSSSIDHVGIYAGNGQIIHSSSPKSGGVIYSNLNSGYYANTYYGARRIIR